MGTQILGAAILWLIVLAVVVVIGVYLLRWLYRRSTKEVAFVRTGFGGECVVINSGAFVIPVLHEVSPVNMNVMRIEVRRADGGALITRDRMRVDIVAEFFLRVSPTREAVALASQTLGRRAMQPDSIRDLFEGKFASALRTVAAEMTLQDMHEKRGVYMARVREHAAEALAYNGLELESVALVDIDQTSLDHFDPSNAFDAEGLTQITEIIESRRRARNQIEQQTMLDIRNQNLDSERRVLEIERETEYARLEQEREIEVRRAMQRAELARERAMRDHEAQQAQIEANEATERTRIAQDRALTELRIENEEGIRRREIARRQTLEVSELKSREATEREEIALGLAVERERIERQRAQEALEVARRQAVELAEREREIALSRKSVEVIAADIEARRAEIASRAEIERERLAGERSVDEARIERERAVQALEIGRRQAFEEAEIVSGEEIERARIAAERGVREAHLLRERDLRRLEIDRDRLVELAEIERAVELANRSKERSEAIAGAEAARAHAVQAEEQAMTTRERAIAERRKMVELIATARDTERERLRLIARAEAEREAAMSFAEAQRIAAQAEADATVIRADAEATRQRVDAEGARLANEADNVLSGEARASRVRMKLLDKIEGIVRESVRPMEKIEGINILHVDGLGAGQDGRRTVTDEVIDSALRYRVQAPMIDSLMKEVGIEGGSVGRMTDVLRDAKDIDALTRNRQKSPGAPAGGPPPRDDDRDR
ncbi:flotillin domain-containing protein [Acidisphaera rubrifaciens]|uniref:Band 7 domain-containing protein n=1 Tax=Acidisphaera rubrifaciens HS-AP3 TaxID=1231350 RepID=A0A0D6P6I1_9PROT|nr:flotillin domain-containing protein [Acidisphaera rubrifaciens]GAN76803.1 hypothetical protein Asru_0165_11 [Acidisphaera rubrifaciens HS-AP3]